MNRKLYYLVCILLLLTAPLAVAQSVAAVQQDAHSAWVRTLNESPETLQKFYTPDAIRVFPSGKILQGNVEIAGWWEKQRMRIDSAAVIQSVEPHVDSYRYDISVLRTTDGKTFKELIIWNLEDASPKRELELVAEVWPLKNYNDQLDARRAQWELYCNNHQVEDLVKELYSKKAIYYNHRPVISGHGAIINTYQYMKNPEYQLRLEPMIVESVNDYMAYEIGQCQGSYPGKYILVWLKDEDGKWYILLDSNI